MSETPVDNPIDSEMLERASRGDKEKTRRLVSLYLKQNKENLQELKQAIKAAEPEKMWHMAHAMSGSAAFLGAHDLVIPLNALEQMGKSGHVEPQSRDLLAQAEKEFTRVETFINALCE